MRWLFLCCWFLKSWSGNFLYAYFRIAFMSFFVSFCHLGLTFLLRRIKKCPCPKLTAPFRTEFFLAVSERYTYHVKIVPTSYTRLDNKVRFFFSFFSLLFLKSIFYGSMIWGQGCPSWTKNAGILIRWRQTVLFILSFTVKAIKVKFSNILKEKDSRSQICLPDFFLS